MKVRGDPSMVYLFLHNLLLRKHNSSILSNAEMVTFFRKHFKYKGNASITCRDGMVNDMVEQGLIEKVNQQKFRIINRKASKFLDFRLD